MESKSNNNQNNNYKDAALNRKALELIPRIKAGDKQAIAELFFRKLKEPTSNKMQYDYGGYKFSKKNYTFIKNIVRKHIPYNIDKESIDEIVQDAADYILETIKKNWNDSSNSYIGYAHKLIKTLLNKDGPIYANYNKYDKTIGIINTVKKQMYKTYGREPAIKDIAVELGYPFKTISKKEVEGQKLQYQDKVYATSNEKETDIYDAIIKQVTSLSDQDREVLYYITDKPEVLADKFNISKEDAEKRIKDVINKIRESDRENDSTIRSILKERTY